jgi:hypothetical protein
VTADVRQSADARGRMPTRVVAPPRKPSFFERVFGPRRR